MLQRVYKVVLAEDGKLKSAWWAIPKTWCVIYKKGRWVAPRKPTSYLFAFNSLSWARGLIKYWDYRVEKYELWEARADVVRRDGEPFVIATPHGALPGKFAEFWRLLKKATGADWWEKERFHQSDTDTLYCRKIKLVKKIS